MTVTKIVLTFWITCWTLSGFCQKQPTLTIFFVKEATALERLSAQELQRYLYVRTGKLPRLLVLTYQKPLPPNSILVATQAKLRSLTSGKSGQDVVTLQGDQYQLKSITPNKLLIVGGSDMGVLYGTYRFLQTTGIGFTLHGDIIPDIKLKLIPLSGFNQTGKPTFSLRGIQPFHDFPEGPDWWSEDDYKAIITQLPKMGMNFIGLHTYPEFLPFEGYHKAEPTVWIGQKSDVNTDGTVKRGYPVLHANTLDSTWGYHPKKTSDFSFGAAQLFESDTYGPDYMKSLSPWPHTDAENKTIFNQVGSLLNHSFSLAKRLGVKTCLGTETPLAIPQALKTHLWAEGKDPEKSVTKQALYEGIFSRIKATHPLDYYWFWTSEDWTWKAESDSTVNRTVTDLADAVIAAKNVHVPFTLATCGWVLGPTRDRTEFDRTLPKNIPFGVINRQQGFTPVEPAFRTISGRPKWEISWVEDDPALTSPQFWAGRILKDAADAYKYGCTGFMGIHWRTQILAPGLLALSRAGWEAASYKTPLAEGARDYPVTALYREWTTTEFGSKAADKLSVLFEGLDGGPLYVKGKTERKTNFPRSSTWGVKGPGMVHPNPKPWAEVEKDYAFVTEFESAKPLIEGAGNKERYNYWLNTFYFARSQGQVGCLLGEMELLEKRIKNAEDTKQRADAARNLLAIRQQAAQMWETMVNYQLQAVNTTGEMGTLANLEQHSLASLKLLTKYDSLVSTVLKIPTPALAFRKTYNGPSRLVVTTKRTLLAKGEDLTLKVRVLTPDAIESAILFWKPIGQSTFSRQPLTHISQNVYDLFLHHNKFSFSAFEYYVEVKPKAGQLLRYPSGIANQTIVVW